MLNRKASSGSLARGLLGTGLLALALLAGGGSSPAQAAEGGLTEAQQGTLTAAIAEKKSSAEIIALANTPGMDVGDVVAFVIKAEGGGPSVVYDIVYAAAAAGGNIDKIISGATAGATKARVPIATVVNAALAGVESKDKGKVFKAAEHAGYTPSQIGSAYVAPGGGAGEGGGGHEGVGVGGVNGTGGTGGVVRASESRP